MGTAAICIVTMHFLGHRCFPSCGHNIPTKFGDIQIIYQIILSNWFSSMVFTMAD